MDAIRRYPGLAGEIVRQFIRFETWIVCIPMAIAWLLFAILSHLLDSRVYNPYLNYFLLFLSVSLIALFTGRFAMAAAHGDYHCGFVSHKLEEGEMLAFALRYVLYNLVWLVPLLLIIYFVFKGANPLEWYILLKLGISIGYAGIWYALLMVLVFFGPLLAILLAAYTRSLGEVFSLAPWSWLWTERSADLPAYIAQAVGGLALFLMKYFFPLFVLKILAFQLSMKLGVYLNNALGILPILLVPILLGRLAGAFVAMDEIDDVIAQPENPGKPNQRRANFLAEQKKQYERISQQIDQWNPAELAAETESLQGVEANIYQMLSLSYLYKKTKTPEQALVQARKAISASLAEGLGYEAVKCFRYYFKEKSALKLDPEQLSQLAHYLTLQNGFADAAWCYLMAILQLPDEEKLGMQKKFLYVADTAQKQGAREVATSLYTLFCEQFPDSPLAEFAKQQL